MPPYIYHSRSVNDDGKHFSCPVSASSRTAIEVLPSHPIQPRAETENELDCNTRQLLLPVPRVRGTIAVGIARRGRTTWQAATMRLLWERDTMD